MSTSTEMTSALQTSTLHVWSERLYYARRGNTRTSSRRRARRKVTFNPGGRICPRRNGAHSRGGTRRELGQASDRHRFIESASSRGRAAAAKAWLAQNKATGQKPPKERPQPQTPIPDQITFAQTCI